MLLAWFAWLPRVGAAVAPSAGGVTLLPTSDDVTPPGPTRLSILVLGRGESFRPFHTEHNGGNSTDQSICTEDSIGTQQRAATAQLALLEALNQSLDVTLALHTYEVANCTSMLAELYNGCAQPPARHLTDTCLDSCECW